MGAALRDIRINGKYLGKAVFRDNGNFQVGPGILEKTNRRRRQHAVSQRTQANHRDAAARGETIESVRLPGHAWRTAIRR